jgi:hypothetical protein
MGSSTGQVTTLAAAPVIAPARKASARLISARPRP